MMDDTRTFAKRAGEIHANQNRVHSRHGSRSVLNSATVSTGTVVMEACLSVETMGWERQGYGGPVSGRSIDLHLSSTKGMNGLLRFADLCTK